MVLFTNLVSNNSLHLSIENIGNEDIDLSGFAQAVQNCNKYN